MMIALAILSSAQAAVFASILDLDALSDTADHVVIGEVSEVMSRRVLGGIVTEVTVDISETLIGTPVSELTLTLPGGQIQGETLTVSGVPHLLAGHDLLLFLEEGQPVGFTQGIFFTDGVQAYSATNSRPAPVPIEEVRRSLR